MIGFYPWHDGIRRAMSAGGATLPQAILYHGPSGCGKTGLALEFGGSLLCAASIGAGQRCGSCRDCRLFDASTHPDLHLLTTEAFVREHPELGPLALRYDPDSGESRSRRRNPRHQISVEQVRTMIDAVQSHSHGGAARVVLVAPASAMNANAANALLKILEEPPGETRFLLVAATLERLPPTVRSRCMKVFCPPPGAEEGRRWIAEQWPDGGDGADIVRLAPGAPVTALRWARDNGIEQFRCYLRGLAGMATAEAPEPVLESWSPLPVERLAAWLQRDLAACARIAAGSIGVADEEPDRAVDLKSIARQSTADTLWQLVLKIGWFRRLPPLAVDERLFLDDIVNDMREALGRRRLEKETLIQSAVPWRTDSPPGSGVANT
jgi:DNA polymerase-3 subunit delta'